LLGDFSVGEDDGGRPTSTVPDAASDATLTSPVRNGGEVEASQSRGESDGTARDARISVIGNATADSNTGVAGDAEPSIDGSSPEPSNDALTSGGRVGPDASIVDAEGDANRDGAAQDVGDAGAASPIFVHTATQLFALDPTNPVVPVAIGAFDWIGGAGQDAAMTDLAVDKSGSLWGISARYAYQLVVQSHRAS
jgi:hypothetical protein